MRGDDLQDVIKDDPSLVLKYATIKQSVHMFHLDSMAAMERCKEKIPNEWAYNGIGARLEMPLYPHHFSSELGARKKRHYWLWSKCPDKGKSTFLHKLSQKFPCSSLTTCETFQSVRKDSQFILIDEY